MELNFTGRGLHITEEMRATAAHKLAPLERLEPRATRLDVEIVNENHPAPSALKLVEGALYIPKKTFRAHAEAADIPSALDELVERLERQVRDHHSKQLAAKKNHPTP